MNENLQKLLVLHNVSVYKLSKGAGIPYSTLSDWIKGKTSLSPDKLSKIADYFGVSIDYLLGRDNEIDFRIQFSSDDEAKVYLEITGIIEKINIEGMKEVSRYLKYVSGIKEYQKKDED